MHRFFLVLSKGMAYVGGVVLSALVGIVVLSVIGREFNGLLHADFMQNNLKWLADGLLDFRIPGIWGDIKIGPFNGDYEIVEAGMAYDPATKNLCTIFDLQIAAKLPEDQKAKAYRMVNLEQVTEIRCSGKVFTPDE